MQQTVFSEFPNILGEQKVFVTLEELSKNGKQLFPQQLLLVTMK